MGGMGRATRFVFASVVLLLVWLVPASAFAAPVANVDATTTHLQLAPYLDVFEDTTAALGLDDVKRPDVAARFELFHGSAGPNYGYTRSAVWVRFDVENTGESPVERWLVVDPGTVDHVEVFREGEPPSVQGSLHPRADRELPRRTYSFRVALAPHETRRIFLRSWGESEVQLRMDLWERGALEVDDRVFTTCSALAYGVMFALALYNTFLFLFVRARAHLYYAGQVVCLALWVMCLDDTMGLLLAPRMATVPHAINVITGYSGGIFALLFVRQFLRVQQHYPRVHRALGAYVWFVVLLGALYLFGVIGYRTENILGAPSLIALVLVSIVLAVLRWRAGFIAARYLVLAWSTLAALAIIGEAATEGVGSPRIDLLIHAAYALEAILFSIALADAAKRRNDHVAALHRASARFVPFELLALLGKHELPQVKQGDQIEREMTTFFLDVRSFTSIVEEMTPEQTIAFVNAVFSKMEGPIAKRHGVIDKFMGDGVMALFARADDAVAAAVACLGALDGFNAEREKRGERRLAVGIGLHTGPLMVGTVGGGERLSCTVIGDSVNLGSRIEGMTKTFGASILMTEATHAALAAPSAVEVRSLGRVAAKGKARAVGLYEVLDGLAPDERARKLAARSDFERAVGAFIAGDIAEARRAFAAWPHDAAAAVYVELCGASDDATRAAWDGAVRLDAK